MFQAASRAVPGVRFRVDCLPCVSAFHKGRAWAATDNRPLARVHRLMHEALEEAGPECMVWMPAHTKAEDVGVLELGNGEKLTVVDRHSNAEADRLAKLAVEEHRVPAETRRKVRTHEALVEHTARWIAVATHAAGHQEVPPFRDTAASRQLAAVAAKTRCSEPRPIGRNTVQQQRPVELGGHVLTRSGGRWSCTVCRCWSKAWSRIAHGTCAGPAAARWVKKSMLLPRAGQAQGLGHVRVLSGSVVWCCACGAYAEASAKQLLKPCPGKNQGRRSEGGLQGQLRALRSGRHPRTLKPLPPPVSEASVGTEHWLSLSTSKPLPGASAHVGFSQGLRAPTRLSPKVQAMLARVRAREAAAAVEAGSARAVKRRICSKTTPAADGQSQNKAARLG